MHDDPLYDDPLYEATESDPAQAPSSRADELIDELMPDGFEWRRLVCTYPRTALLASLVGGFVIGRNKGLGLLTGISGYFIGEVTRNVQGFVDDLTGG